MQRTAQPSTEALLAQYITRMQPHEKPHFSAVKIARPTAVNISSLRKSQNANLLDKYRTVRQSAKNNDGSQASLSNASAGKI